MGDVKKLSLLEETVREARKIEKELEKHPELEDIRVTEEMDAALFAKIQAYEESKEKENREDTVEFSEELMPEIPEKEEKKIVTYRKSSKKKYIIIGIAAVLAVVMGTGLVGMGNKSYWKKVSEKEYGQDELRVIKVEDMDDIESEDGKNIKTIYDTIEKEMGISIVKMKYFPKELLFSSLEIAEDMQSARVFYKYEGEVIRYSIYLNSTDSERAENLEDMKVNEYIVANEHIDIKVEEYSVPEYKELRRCADFEYGGIHYQLKGKMEKEEFDKILENLRFF
ncbi:MAG: DUF4367 domain-containing protein [Schaedlerella sp.]|nr:DUF4367 domain-containing protein [Schaedlerella sp.]